MHEHKILLLYLARTCAHSYMRTRMHTQMQLCPLLPLCLMSDLSALQYSSMAGLGGIVYTLGFVMKRCLDGSYSPGGRFNELMDVHLRPSALASRPGFWAVGPGTLVLLNMAGNFGGGGQRSTQCINVVTTLTKHAIHKCSRGILDPLQWSEVLH